MAEVCVSYKKCCSAFEVFPANPVMNCFLLLLCTNSLLFPLQTLPVVDLLCFAFVSMFHLYDFNFLFFGGH